MEQELASDEIERHRRLLSLRQKARPKIQGAQELNSQNASADGKVGQGRLRRFALKLDHRQEMQGNEPDTGP